jgi:hypothetical protein
MMILCELNQEPVMNQVFPLRFCMLNVLVWTLSGRYVLAAERTLIASDALNYSSFNTGLNWDDAQAPKAGNTYVVPGGRTLGLRCPVIMPLRATVWRLRNLALEGAGQRLGYDNESRVARFAQPRAAELNGPYLWQHSYS